MSRKALIVGIDDYPTAPLNGCVNDAKIIDQLLSKNEDNSPNFDTHCITSKINKSQLQKVIKELFRTQNDISLLYFSGHGYTDDSDGYLVTSDFSEDILGVSVNEIIQLANESPANNRVIILDCCYAGKCGDQNIGGTTISNIKSGVTILTGCDTDEFAVEKNGQGVFTQLLIEAISGSASDLLGNITPASIYAFIDKALGSWGQRPIFKTNIRQFISLRSVVPPIDRMILRKISDYFSDATYNYSLDPSYEDTNDISVEHKYIEPYARQENINIFKDLQKMVSVGLVKPVDSEHMYYAAMNSKSCCLTSLGQYYWHLAKNDRL